MPLLTYSASDFPFQPFSKIYSASVNACLIDIRTLLNTTGLDTTNVQLNGLNRNRLALGTIDHVLINGADGNVSSEAQLALTRGGTGLSIVPGSQTPGDVIQVNSGGTALEVAPPTVSSAPTRIFNYYQFS
jgi:hypothetical protein